MFTAIRLASSLVSSFAADLDQGAAARFNAN